MKKLAAILYRFIVWLIIMVVLAMIINSSSDTYYVLSLKYELYFFWYMLTFVVAFLTAHLLQLAGMLVFGPRSGYTLVELSLFGLGWHRDLQGQLHFCRRRPIRRFCHLQTPPAYDGRSPYRLFLMGGTIFSSILCTLCFAAFFLFRHIPEMFYVVIFGVGMLLVTLLNLIPARNMPFGYVRMLNRSLVQRQVREHHMFVHANQRQGLTMADMPEDFCRPYPEELWQDQLVFGAQHNYGSRLLAEGRHAEALDVFIRLDSFLSQPSLKMQQKDIHRLYVTCGGAIAEMMCGAAVHFSDRINEPNIELFLGQGGWQSQLLLAQYLRELLVTRDEAAAQQRLSALEQLPEPLSQGQKRIMTQAQALAANDTQEEAHEEE